MYRRLSVRFWFGFLILLLVGCDQVTPSPTVTPSLQLTGSATLTATATSSPTATPVPPTPTPEPLAALVNQTPITLAQFQAELARYRQALGKDLSAEDRKRVMDSLVDQVLLAQAAAEKGFVVDDQSLQARLEVIVQEAGGAQAFAAWLADNQYDQESFRRDLRQSILAAWMRDQIVASVPLTMEQVHARQILLYNSEQADQVWAQLQAGKDFATLAKEYDPLMNGDLGWFPRGYLSDEKLEQAAFSLEPGKYSAVIETRLGFHILQVIERDPQRALDPQARLTLQTQALRSWLEMRRSQSQIQILVP